MREFIQLAGRVVLPYSSGILTAVLPCLSYDDRKKSILHYVCIYSQFQHFILDVLCDSAKCVSVNDRLSPLRSISSINSLQVLKKLPVRAIIA